MKLLFFICIISIFTRLAAAEKSVINISGNDYKGKELNFFTITDPFFKFRKVLFTTSIPIEGTVTDTIELTHSLCIFIETGPYMSYFFVEPGNDYSIVLPDIKNLSDEWKQNPYFEKIPRHLKISSNCISCKDNSTELNGAIREFDSEYEPFLDKQLVRYYSPDLSKQNRDSFVNVVYTDKSVSDQKFYNNYRDYQLAILEFSVISHNLDSIIDQYIIGRKVNFDNPAYRNLFSLIFNDYFSHLSKKDGFRDIYKQLSTLSHPQLQDYLQSVEAFQNDTILNQILLHEIYKSYYSANYDKNALLELLRSMTENHNQLTSEVAGKLYGDLTSLRAGFPAPVFNLISIDGKPISTGETEGKYLYIGFCNVNSYECLMEFEYLKYLQAKHGKYLTIVTVIPYDENNSLHEMAESNLWNWDLISSQESDKLLSDYKVKAFPNFYLIGRDGILLMSPAPNPSKGFEQQLFSLMRSKGEI